MNNIYISLIIAAGITVLAVLTKPRETKNNHIGYGLKIYIISFLVSFVSLTYLLTESNVKQIIETGEPEF
jgi:anaerobic C4-dicarboxylate transporter